MTQRAGLPITGNRADTNDDASRKDAHGHGLLDGVRAGKSATKRLTPVTTSASDRNVARARREGWSTSGASPGQHTPNQ